ncbi:hypothetical protein [Thermostichus vulcanus]|uniref:hypothetical protein n=1 Tax=Thermostichus vulcanus TaxID=32053 RepID=UPI003CC62424
MRLNASGWTTPQIAQPLHQCEHTVRQTLQRWARWAVGSSRAWGQDQVAKLRYQSGRNLAARAA